MDSFKITLEIGNDQQGKDIRLSDFVTELQRFADVARNAEAIVSGGTRNIYYRVIDLKHSSPARVTLEACLKNPEHDRRADTIREMSTTMSKLKKGEEIPGSDRFYLVDSMRSFAEPIGTRISHLKVIFGGKNKINLDQEFKARAALYVAPEESCMSTARGMLDVINIHGTERVFWLYPEIGANKIQCIFPDSLFEKAKMALGRRIEVTGMFKYKINAPYAHLAEVNELEILPLDDDLPTFEDILGIEPEMTNGLSCDDYIGKLRSEN